MRLSLSLFSPLYLDFLAFGLQPSASDTKALKKDYLTHCYNCMLSNLCNIALSSRTGVLICLLLNSNANFDIDTVSDRIGSNASVYKSKIPSDRAFVVIECQ